MCIEFVHGSTNGIPISSKVKPMVPLAIPLVPMVMPTVPFALPMVLLVPLVSQMVQLATNGTIGRTPNRATVIVFVHGSTNSTNGIPISFKVLPMVPLVVPLVPLVKTVGSQYCRQSKVWEKITNA